MVTAQGANPAVRELIRVVEPPLRYLASGATRRLAHTALPLGTIRSRIRAALAAEGEPPARQLLEQLEAAFRRFPTLPVEGRHREVLQALAVIDSLKSAPSPPAPAPPRPVHPGPALEALKRPVQYLRGVGPRRAAMLARMRISTVEDLLYHLPFRYEDRRHVRPIADILPGAEASVVGEIVSLREGRAPRQRRPVLEARVRDATGVLTVTWFHQIGYFRERHRPGQRVVLHGRVESGFGGGLRMIHPDVELLEEGEAEVGGIAPIYNKPTGMSLAAMRRLVRAAVTEYAARVPSALPAAVVERQGLLPLGEALRQVHCPGRGADIERLQSGRSQAHRTIVFDELFYLQLGMALRKHSAVRETGISFRTDGKRARALTAVLPFRLTKAQARTVREIAADMAAPHPMNRLVHGDVGSGKTVVALAAAMIAVDNGYQVALMAPTELLAEQHLETIGQLAAPLGLRTALLTRAVPQRRRRLLLRAIRSGHIDLVVGTHALIQERVSFSRLGLAIVDEQHRFGVLQRAALARHGTCPDVLVMTATPIPRTLALTLYGDLDVSFVDEKPPGRPPVSTTVVAADERPAVYAAVRRSLDAGHQGYVVYPLVEESERSDLQDATTMAAELSRGAFRGYRLGLLHGRLRAEEKEGVMRRFKAGDFHLLVSTTVVEVGIDVPNATVMVVEHAERFGLAQLHQLRGRIGRGSEAAQCWLIADYRRSSDEAYRRLRVLEETSDGFRVAEADLALRGPGEFLGTRQAGLPDFRAANLLRDSHILQAAHQEATAWLASDAELSGPASRGLREVLRDRWAGRLELARVG